MSTVEWIPSENIAELPVIVAATNLVTAMAKFPIIAAITVKVDEEWATD